MNTILLQNLVNPNVNLQIILPEMIVALTGIIVMLYDCFVPRQRKVTGAISLVGLAISAFFLLSSWNEPAYTAWNGMVAHDGLRLSFSLVFLFTSAITILISTVWTDREKVPVGEYHAMLLFAKFGSMFMA